MLACCSPPKPRGFESASDLKNAYKSFYESGDLNGLKGMVYWDDTPEDIRASLSFMMSFDSGEHKFDSLEIVPESLTDPPENLTGYELEATIEVTHWLIGSHRGNTGFQGKEATGNVQLGIGVKDGRYYISGARIKATQAEQGGEPDT